MRPALSWAEQAARVLAAWGVLLLAEHLVVAIGYRGFLAGSWEIRAMRASVIPIALAALLPAALVSPGLAEIAWRSNTGGGARAAGVSLAALAGAAVAYGVSTGRHFASVPLRVAFVVAVAGASALAARVVLPWLARGRARPAVFAGAALAVACAAWLGDAFVLPRLYPAFHLALFATTLAAVALAAVAPPPLARTTPRPAALVAAVGLALAVACMLRAPAGARALRGMSNLRILLVERAPLLGRAVRVAGALAPPPDDDDAADGTLATLGVHGEVPRALDWTGHDIVLLTVDALRADHVSAYGYGRPLTPSLDALAAQGTLFEAAYCPTPHTSYSLTSMMTGKYMRPLLALGLGADSDTWASDVRRYGYRTAAFYPPAVFFIDEDRFGTFEKSELGFEYAKVEFASAKDRAAEVAAYLDGIPAGNHPLFLWVHLFEPHEPYVMHPDHPMGDPASPTDVDAYDSEIAAADEGIGAVLAAVRAKRPGAVIIASADHGEEFGEHGGRYHGTTVYEEQVRVPLIVAGPGVAAGARAKTVVQTIDLLPTVLSALGIPRPARLRGRDLGPVLAGTARDPGFAFAETDDYALGATGEDRLVCLRSAAACFLFDVSADPQERHDLSPGRDTASLLASVREVERDTGKFEGPSWPEALRLGIQGETSAAPEVAELLDDADVTIRRKAAEVLFDLRAESTLPALGRAFAHDEDETVRRWCALALGRMVGTIPSAGAAVVDALLKDSDVAWRRRAALVLAEQGDGRGGAELAAFWSAEAPPHGAMEPARAKELLAAMTRIRDRAAVAPLVASLGDVRLRPFVADALGAIGDASAAPALLAAFAGERYVTARPPEARALLALGVKKELAAPLARFAGIPQPMAEAVSLAAQAGLLVPKEGGWASPSTTTPTLDVELTPPASARPLRMLVLLRGEGSLDVALEGAAVAEEDSAAPSTLHVLELGARPPAPLAVHLSSPSGIAAVWIVARADELPPPPPAPWNPP